MGAISGSGFTGVAATGSIMIPRMEEQGYERGYATALVTVSSVLWTSDPAKCSHDYVRMGYRDINSCMFPFYIRTWTFDYGVIYRKTCNLEQKV